MRSAGRKTFYLYVSIVVCWAGGCLSEKRDVASVVFEDAAIEAYRTDLIELAFSAASAMPLEPHVKSRSQAQAAVVQACLDLEQPQRAAAYADDIKNWRQGDAYGKLAQYGAERGAQAKAMEFIDAAIEIAEQQDGWRRDRVRVKVAQAYILLGKDDAAASLEGVLEERAESGKTARAQAILCKDDEFDAQVAVLDHSLVRDDIDNVKNLLAAYTQLYIRFYENDSRRAELEGKIKGAWKILPIFLRLDLLDKMTQAALDHHDTAHALTLTREAKTIVDEAVWPPSAKITVDAKLAVRFYQAGDPQTAQTLIKSAERLFNKNRKKIVNIDRAEALVAIAEAYQGMGQTSESLATYKRAVSAGVENPNSRPRAEDLSATCCSMARQGVAPDAALWRAIRETQQALGDSW